MLIGVIAVHSQDKRGDLEGIRARHSGDCCMEKRYSLVFYTFGVFGHRTRSTRHTDYKADVY